MGVGGKWPGTCLNDLTLELIRLKKQVYTGIFSFTSQGRVSLRP